MFSRAIIWNIISFPARLAKSPVHFSSTPRIAKRVPAFCRILTRLVDTFLGLVLPMLLSAFGILLMREYASTIPNDYIEAARIDGCSELKIFFQIIMPMLKPGLAALAIIKFLWTWNAFFWPLLIIVEAKKAVVTLGISFLSNQYYREYHLITAAAIMSLLPLFALFLILRNLMVKALTGAGLKF